jgi:formylglycine-generating enzyme required for sulfatase activity
MPSSSESTVKSILPAPFDWCEIRAGEVTLAPYEDPDYGWKDPQSYLKTTIPSFAIAKYPVTNSQYAKFIEAGSYQNRKWWTDAGWKLHQEGLRWLQGRPDPTGKAWAAPLFWQDRGWNGADYPVVGISWYEALAFCRWLSEKSGEKITLPNEHQWQWAAQGDDKRAYPWGNDWDASRCNNNVDKQGIGRTSSVRQYEGKGDSFFGAVDMSGNVWEWLLTKSSGQRGSSDIEGADDRMIRGGSWVDGTYQPLDNNDDRLPASTFFRTDYRETAVAAASLNHFGFRIVRTGENR